MTGSVTNAALNLAKISAPVVADAIERPRLFEVMDETAACPILWLHGPAGSGKTTLVTSYTQTRKLTRLWYRVEPGDADPASLFHFLRLASKRASPRSRKALPPEFEPEFMAGIPAFSRRFFRDLFARLNAPFVVVFDNYQDVARESPFHEILKEGLSEIPRAGRAVVVSRTEPHPAFSRFGADRHLVRMDWRQLRFTEDETLALLQRWARPSIGRAAVQSAMEKTQGWVAGLVLLLAGSGPTHDDDIADGLSPGEDLFDYFATEVFDKLDPGRRDFLLRTAFLPDMTPALAASLSGVEHAGVVLANLARDGFFTERHGKQNPLYLYHPLFRQFLLDRARAVLPSSEIAALERRAAGELAAFGRLEEAIGLARDLEDWETLARLVQEHATEVIRSGRHRTLESWLGRVPDVVLDDHPWLRYWLGVSRFYGDPESAIRSLTRSHERFKQREDSAGAFTSWATIVRYLAEFARYQEGLDAWLDGLEDLTQSFPTFPSKEVECRVALSMLAGLGYRRPWHPDLDDWGQRALRLAEETGDVSAEFFVCLERLHRLVFMPLTPLRLALFERLRRLLSEPGITVMDRMRYFFALAVHHCLMGNHRACVESAESALGLAREYGISWFVPTVLYTLGRSHQHVGNLEEAADIAARIGKLAETAGEAALSYHHALMAAQNYLLGRFVEAEREAAAGIEMLGATSLTWGHVIVGFILVHVLSELGKPSSARERVEPLLAFAEESGNTQLLHHCHLCEAEIEFNRGDSDAALIPLRRALELAGDLDVSHAYLWRPAALSRLFGLALERNISVETVRRMIRQRDLHPGADAWDLESWPWKLRLRTLGDFGVFIDGERMAFKGKAQKRPLSLLKVLIAFGGRGVSTERLKDALWPDADGDAAQRAFDTTLYRLRRLLGVEGALVLGEGRLSVSPEVCWTDVLVLKDLVGKAMSAIKKPHPNPAQVALLQKRILELYQGDFLEDLSEDRWVLSARHDIAARMLHFLGAMGQLWERTGHWTRAAACYRKGLEMDRLSGTQCAGLLRSLRNLGDGNEALDVYRHFRAKYHEHTGQPPPRSVETARRSLDGIAEPME